MKIMGKGEFQGGEGEKDDGWVAVTSGAPPRPSSVSAGVSELKKKVREDMEACAFRSIKWLS
jgi:hypothetical protein